MIKKPYSIETELSLLEAYKLRYYHPEAVFEIHPVKRDSPVLFDYFDTLEVSKEVEYAVWDIMELINPILQNGELRDGVEKLFPAGLRLLGTLEMPYELAFELLEEFRNVLPSHTLLQIHQDLREYTDKILD